MKRRVIEVILAVAVSATGTWLLYSSPSSNLERLRPNGPKIQVDGVQLGEERSVVDAKLGVPVRVEALPQNSFEVCFYRTGTLVCLAGGRCIEVVGRELKQDGKLILTSGLTRKVVEDNLSEIGPSDDESQILPLSKRHCIPPLTLAGRTVASGWTEGEIDRWIDPTSHQELDYVLITYFRFGRTFAVQVNEAKWAGDEIVQFCRSIR